MAKGSKAGACSAHVEPAKANCLKHDRREGKIPSYVNPHLTQNNRVVFEDEMIRGRKSIIPLKHQAEKLYTAKTGQKCQKSFTPFREDVLHIKEGVTDEQLMKFKADVEALTGWKVVGIWLHQDEGYARSKYIEGDEDFAINYHAHVLYDCQDHQTGKAIRQHRDYFRKRQDILAKATGMERGNPAAVTGARHRSAMEQRIHAQEERISELERIAAEKEKQHQKEIKRLKARISDTFWRGLGRAVDRFYGEDKAFNDLKKQNKALQARLDDAEEEVDILRAESRQKASNLLLEAKEEGKRELINKIWNYIGDVDIKSGQTLDIFRRYPEEIGKAFRHVCIMLENVEHEVRSLKSENNDLRWWKNFYSSQEEDDEEQDQRRGRSRRR